jgi:amino acid transporter
VAGVISLLLGYTVVKLGVRYPSCGGVITYLMEGFGNGRLVGIAAWMGYFAAILLVGAMIAVSFGDYATSLFIGTGAAKGWSKLFASLCVLAMAVVNVRGVRGVEKAQSAIVVVLLAVFAVFIVATFTELQPHLLSPHDYPAARKIISSVALTFFAYLGFAVISFAAGDIPDPARSLPRAMYTALGIATSLYILISLGVFGSLTVDQVIAYGPTAVAEAARPALGQAGFAVMSIAALLATSSSVPPPCMPRPG